MCAEPDPYISSIDDLISEVCNVYNYGKQLQNEGGSARRVVLPAMSHMHLI